MAASQVTSSSARTASPRATRRRASPSRMRVLAGDSAPVREASATVGGYAPGAVGGSVQVEAGAVRAVAASRLSRASPAQTGPALAAATTVVFAPVDAARSASAKAATD